MLFFANFQFNPESYSKILWGWCPKKAFRQQNMFLIDNFWNRGGFTVRLIKHKPLIFMCRFLDLEKDCSNAKFLIMNYFLKGSSLPMSKFYVTKNLVWLCFKSSGEKKFQESLDGHLFCLLNWILVNECLLSHTFDASSLEYEQVHFWMFSYYLLTTAHVWSSQ